MRKLILASSSPRRSEILKRVGLDFSVIPADADEKSGLPEAPGKLVETLAERKADAVIKTGEIENSIIIAADTVVYYNGRVLTKPESSENAVEMLLTLSGKTHYVYSGLCVADSNHRSVSHTITGVRMREISPEEARDYVLTKEPLDKAGAYGIQGIGGIFVEGIDGDYYNVMGLPLEKLCLTLKEQFDFNVLDAAKNGVL